MMLLTLVFVNAAGIIGICLVGWFYIGATERRFRSIEKLLAKSMPVYGQRIPRDTELPRRGFCWRISDASTVRLNGGIKRGRPSIFGGAYAIAAEARRGRFTLIILFHFVLLGN